MYRLKLVCLRMRSQRVVAQASGLEDCIKVAYVKDPVMR
jgi:hypothetical protein